MENLQSTPTVTQQVTLRVYDPDGWDEFYTIRAETVNELLNNVAAVKDWMKERGYTPAPPPAGRHANGNGHAAASQAQSEPTFMVDKITATIDDGKEYWRVRGGQFQKFGVTIYPEVLAAAGLDSLDPLAVFSEPGMVAHYEVKDNGKPKKVVRLQRGN